MATHNARLSRFSANERDMLEKYAGTKKVLVHSCNDVCDCPIFTVGIHTTELSPPANGVFNDRPRNPHHLTRMHRLDDQTFHFAFMPLDPYPAFPALRYTYTDLPIVAESYNGKQFFWLSKTLIQEWQAVELAIDLTIHDICTVCQLGMPLNYNPARDFRPSRYKYNRGHPDAYEARQAAYTALRAFDARLCMLSYVYFYAAKQCGDAFSKLGPRSRISDEFMEAVKSSWVCNPQFARVGVYIASEDTATITADLQWRRNLWPFLLVEELPIWIAYGTRPFATTDDFCIALAPTDADIQQGFAPLGNLPPPPSAGVPLVTPHVSSEPLPALPLLPPPPPSENLSVFAWLQKRLAQRVKHLAKESAEKRIAREQRECEQQKHIIPGRSGPRVFEWEYDATQDDWLRVSIPRSDRSRIEGLWEETIPSMRSYDGVHNEWDVYRGLHPSVEPRDPYAFIDNDNDYQYGRDAIVDLADMDWEQQQQEMIIREATCFHQQHTARGRSPQRGAQGRSRTPLPTPVSDRVTQHLVAAMQLPEAEQESDHILEDKEVVARDRYALTFPLGWNSEPEISPLTDDHVWVLNIIRVTSSPSQSIRRIFMNNLANCVHNIVQSTVPPFQYANFEVGSLLLERYKWRATPIPFEDWKHASLRLNAPHEQNWNVAEEQPYILEHIDARHVSIDWRLITFGAADASHVIRIAANENIDDKVQLAAQLASIGLPFRLLAKREPDNMVLQRARGRRIGLGYQVPGYTFTPKDYVRYERRRDALLAMPQGRDAARAGGILARLALSAVDMQDILRGPSFTASTAVYAVIDNEEYVDDGLTEDEIDVICGVTRVYTHWTEHSNVKVLSWWPTPKQWKRSGQDVGYWTEQNEAWFKNRLQQIRDGNAKPLNTAGWKSSLKFFKDTPRFEQNLASFSQRVLYSSQQNV